MMFSPGMDFTQVGGCKVSLAICVCHPSTLIDRLAYFK